MVVLFTPTFKARSQLEGSGVGSEVEIMADRLRRSAIFYLPVLLAGTPDTAIPEILGPRDHLYYDLSNWDNRLDVVFSILREKMLNNIPELPGIKDAFDAERNLG